MKKESMIKSIISTAIISMIVIMNSIVLAVDTNYSAGITLTSDSKLKEGETVTINVKLSNVNAGAGIDTLTAGIEYDKNVFEILSTSNFTSSTSWIPTFAPGTNKITAQKSQKVTSVENMFTITLKVKSAINVDSTTIVLKDIVVSGGIIANGGTGDINVNNASVTISKEKAPTSLTEDFEASTTKKPENVTTINDKTSTKKTVLPKTGIGQYGTISVIIIMVAIISFILYKKISKDVK